MNNITNLAFGICSNSSDCTLTGLEIVAPFIGLLLAGLLLLLARQKKYQDKKKYIALTAGFVIGWAVVTLLNYGL